MKPLANSHAVLADVTDCPATQIGWPGPDLAKALGSAPAGVLLDHQPRKARHAAARDVGLQLSGHTHGGLVVGFDRLFALANGVSFPGATTSRGRRST
ncbi:MAG: hypothetical protein ACRYGA_15355 [Janthinobacterium lividum]